MFSIRRLAGVFGILTTSMIAFGQEPSATPPTDRTELRREHMEERAKRHEGRRERQNMRLREGRDHFMRELNLSDAQREQIRTITQRRLEATKSQREELSKMREKRVAGTFTADDEARVKALQEEIRSSMEGVRRETATVLTAEQKAQLEQLKIERKAKREERLIERKARREQRLKERQQRLNQNPL